MKKKKFYSSNFRLFYYSGFPFLNIHENFLKNYWKQNIIFKSFLSNFKLFYYSDFPFLYIHESFLKKKKQTLAYKIIFKVLSSGKWRPTGANSKLRQNSKFKIF